VFVVSFNRIFLTNFSERSRSEARIEFAMRREDHTQRVMNVLVRAMT